MKDLWAVLGMILAALVIGLVLFFFGPSVSRLLFGNPGDSVPYIVLDQGELATAIDERLNFLIQNADELQELWTLLYGADTSAPDVDFSKYSVLAIFEGSHATDGYAIHAGPITDAQGVRTVIVTRTVPGPGCSTTSKITSPFEVVRVPATVLPLTHEDVTETAACP